MGDLLSLLTEYRHRQVVVNFYEEDELVARDGFFFDGIERSDGLLSFIKDGRIRWSIPLDDYPSYEAVHDFPRHYRFYGQHRAVELYFPS
ncbi:hypothetical protein [Geobacillus subterraneus]|uniref:hypothetical protein n=1 Tax=Geobacillus subterraneus TaxID=129338 RepID=UPI00160A22DE